MTERLFWQDPYLLEFEARVLERLLHEGRPAVVLDRTAFYPDSGGQPWDTGRLAGVPVTAVVEDGERILHLLERPLPDEAGPVAGVVDGERRADHRQQHHGQHLLSRAIEDLARADTISFHLGAQSCTIDLDREISEPEAHEAALRANAVVWEARPVRVAQVERAEALRRGLAPAEHVGDRVRVIEVEGFDQNPCGGTHPRSTAEVGVIVVLGCERYKGGTRVEFVCGRRALVAVRERLGQLADVAGVLQAPQGGAAEAARKALERLGEGEKRSRELLEWAIEGEAARLLAQADASPALIVRRYDGWPAADLRLLAQKLTAQAPCVALLGSRADKAHVVFAQTPGLPNDIPALLRAAVEALGGRGGGRGDLAQGGGDRLEALDAALEAAGITLRAARAAGPP